VFFLFFFWGGVLFWFFFYNLQINPKIDKELKGTWDSQKKKILKNKVGIFPLPGLKLNVKL
jgi:hypothetical protein